jgi:hypothetical protein
VLPPSTRSISRSGVRGKPDKAPAKIGASFKTGKIREITGLGAKLSESAIFAFWPGPAEEWLVRPGNRSVPLSDQPLPSLTA